MTGLVAFEREACACRDCGGAVVGPTSDRRCAGCRWIVKIADPGERAALRRLFVERGLIEGAAP